MKTIDKKKLEKLQNEIEFMNNYFSDKLFISVVSDYDLEDVFYSARYDSVYMCKKYISLFYDVFESYLDEEFFKGLEGDVKQIRKEKLEQLKLVSEKQ